jgi:tetratricopeptide (TPR) repeat protein
MMLRVIELPADNAIVYRFAVSAQVFQGKFAAAETTIARAAARLPDNPDVVRMQARYAAARFDFEAATDLFSSLTRGGDGPDWVFAGRLGLADVALIQGRFREAEWHTREAMTLNEARGARRAYLAGAFYLADIHLMRGSSAAAVATIERALERFPPSAVTVADRLYLETVEVLARAGRISEARGVLDEFEREVESAGQRAEFRHRGASAAIALGEGRVEEAVDLLRRYRSQAPGALAGILELGQAYDRLGVRDSAVSYYEQFVNTPAMLPGAGGLMRPGWMGFIAPVLRRLGELYDEGGAESRALEHYRRFLQLWSNADPEFAGEITAARRRVAQLGATRASR